MSNEQQHDFYMVQLWLDARKLTALGKMLHLPLKTVSNNYLVHCGISELFQEQAPKPFYVEDNHRTMAHYNGKDRFIRVLGYSALDKNSLQNLARGFASPAVYEICDWDRTASKPMPDQFPDGMRIGFELRACPVVRKASAGPKWREGQELDVFLSKVWELDDDSVPVDREETYAKWLTEYFDRDGSAKIMDVGMKQFSIARMSRRTHSKNRKVKTIQRPDVTLTGTMEIKDGESFKALLKRGIGRHKSFGFGMLKVRRA